MKRYIHAASDSDSVLDDKIDDIEADFDYIIDGLEKLTRMGFEKDAVRIADELSEALSPIEMSISDMILN
ncbi:MAG: hypothetical protein NC320_03150 [Clostridium sp.]|nr:hypothetical protein [Clostridium sp.]